MNAMKNKCELKQYIADEAEKDKKVLQSKLDVLQTKVKEMEKTSELHDQLSKVDNKAQWAQATRRSQTSESQAALFYEAYRLQLVREAELKQMLKSQEQSDQERNRKTMILEMEIQELKKKFNKVKAQ